MNKLALIFAALACASLSIAEESAPKKFKGDRAGHKIKHIVPLKDVPEAPILSVDKAIASMLIQDGFVLENVAAEPLVYNPVAMKFDGNGRLWVAEMTTFMPDVYGTGEMAADGNISVLEDTDNDGRIDKRTVFIDDIVLPRTVTLVKGGIMYADNSQLYFAEVLEENGKLKLGIHEIADPSYAEGGNVEHKTNTMLYGMDNWYYNSKSNKRYKTLALDTEIPANAQEVYRNKYWKLIRGSSEYRGQWGLTMDDYGRLYHNENSTAAYGEYLRPNSLLKNPGYWPKMGAAQIGDLYIYPARMNPGVNRGYLDGFLTTEKENFGRLKGFTAASGSVVYRGDNFPESFYGMAITPAPAANLISARYVRESEGKLGGEPIYPNEEILASTDERFRPVNLYTAPDGSLYILDMYHGILQHKEFLTSYLAEHIKSRDLDKNNNTMGRIYRLRWKENAVGQQPMMQGADSSELVSKLSHANGWWRDTARRLLIEQQSTDAAPAIKKLIAKKGIDERIAINALWTLHGLNAIDLKTVKKALKHPSTKVKTNAIAVADKLPKKHHKRFAKQLVKLAESDYEIALQVALTAGSIDSPIALKASEKVLNRYGDKPFGTEAVASGLGTRSDEFKEIVGKHPNDRFMFIMNNLGKKMEDRSNRAQLSSVGQQRYDAGKALYNGAGACFACHGKDGAGVNGMGPSFWNSDWVVKSPDTLAKVMLHGLVGPIKVRSTDWQIWNTTAVMPGMAEREDLNDEDLTAISIYIRNAWGNAADSDVEMTPQVYQRTRKETEGRNTPYTAKDFQ